MQAWWCATLSRKKTLAQVFSCEFFEIFKKTYFVEHTRLDAWVKWTKKIVFTKSIHRETPAMAPFLGQLQTSGLTIFPKRESIANAFLWKLGSFSEHQLYRSMLGDYFWFPVTFSMYFLLYQWWISSVIAWRSHVSIMSVIILVLYYFISIILVSILVLYCYYISINIISLALYLHGHS